MYVYAAVFIRLSQVDWPRGPSYSVMFETQTSLFILLFIQVMFGKHFKREMNKTSLFILLFIQILTYKNIFYLNLIWS